MRPEIYLTFFAVVLGTGFISWNLAAPAPARSPQSRAPVPPPAQTETAPPLQPQRPGPDDFPWEQRLAHAASLTTQPESQADALAWLLSCIAEADTPQRLLELAKSADTLRMTPQCLRQTASLLAQQPPAVMERVLMAWASQAGAEILYQSMADDAHPALSRNIPLTGWIFGSRADRMVAALPKPQSTAESLARVEALLKNNGLTTWTEGVFGGPRTSQSFRLIVEQMNPDDHPALVSYLSTNWPQVSRNERLSLFTILSRHMAPSALHDMARQVARSTASDLVLMEYGRTHARPADHLAGFIAELATWPSETSKRELLKGYIDQRGSLTPQEARQLAEVIADDRMKEAIFKAVPKQPD